MEITDKNSLLVLMTAMYIVKWEISDDNAHVDELIGSPFFARSYNDVTDAVIGLDLAGWMQCKKWEHWRAVERRPEELEMIRERIKRMLPWRAWFAEQKRQMVEILLSPFKATPATLAETHFALTPSDRTDPGGRDGEPVQITEAILRRVR